MLHYRKRLIVAESSSFTLRRSLLILEQDTVPQQTPAQGLPSPMPPQEPQSPKEIMPQEAPEPPVAVEQPQDTIISIEKASETSPEFDAEITKALGEVGEQVRSLLNDSKVGIITVSNLANILPNSPNSIIPISQQSLALDLEKGKVIIAETTVGQDGNPTPTLNPGGLLRVGLGHMLNNLASNFVEDPKFSELKGFNYALSTDLAKLAQDKKAKLAFYIEDNDFSREECFAECFAALNGGGAVYTLDVMGKYFPAVLKQIKDILTSIHAGSDTVEPPTSKKVEQPEEPTPDIAKTLTLPGEQ